MRTRQKCVATDTRRSLGCRTTPLEHWSRRKPTVEPRSTRGWSGGFPLWGSSPTLRLIRLTMSAMILAGCTNPNKKIKKERKNVNNYPGRNRTLVTRMVGWYLNHYTKRYCWFWRYNYHPYKTTILPRTNCKICMEDYICHDDFCHLYLSILTNGIFPRRNLLLSNQKMGEWSPM